MCFPSSGKAQRNAQIWEQQQSEKQHKQQSEEAEKQRQIMLQQEADRVRNIQTGNANVDSAFGQFNDKYYGGLQSAYTAANMPTVDEQYAKALDQLKSALAGRGMLESTSGAASFADLEKKAGEARTTIGNNALDFTQQVRSKVNDSRNNLYAQSQAAADPNAIARSATGEATSLAQQGALTPQAPLGNIFADFLAPFAQAVSSSQNSYSGGGRSNLNLAPIGSNGNAGSSRIVA